MTNQLKRHMVYKKVKVSMPHCNICGERLAGNGSGLQPYLCSCGFWNWDFMQNTWKIKNK